MTEFFGSAFLAFIQGATEFLPISSSAHLILLPQFMGWQDQGLSFDVAVHVGTLAASIIYFRQEIRRIVIAWANSLAGQESSAESRLGWFIIVASIPVAVFGALFHSVVENDLRNPAVIGAATAVFAILLWYADRFRRGQRTLESMNWKDAILIGLGQAIALIPGTSRSGITMTVGLMMGLSRGESARFAFLLAIPAIAMAGGYQTLVMVSTNTATLWPLFLFSVVVSALVAYLCIHYFLRFIERVGMMPFVIYRLVLAVMIFVVISG